MTLFRMKPTPRPTLEHKLSKLRPPLLSPRSKPEPLSPRLLMMPLKRQLLIKVQLMMTSKPNTKLLIIKTVLRARISNPRWQVPKVF